MKDESRPKAAPGSGGPGSTVQVDPDKFVPCDCLDAIVLWAILSGDAPAPNTVGWRMVLHFAEAIAQRKLAAIRPVLAHSDMWDGIGNRYADRFHAYTDADVPAWARSGNAMLARRRGDAA